MAGQRRFSGANDLSTPGARIKFLRLAKEMSQEALAKQVFTSQPAVSMWENDVWLPSPQSQRLLAEALGSTRGFLFGEAVAS